jgi:hypothetical protein
MAGGQNPLAHPENPLNNQIQCLVSIGTGVPAAGSFGKDVFAIGHTLVRMATETEVTANDFQREHEELDVEDRYFRFNVLRGLEMVKLEYRKSHNVIATQTQAYGSSGPMQKDLRTFERSWELIVRIATLFTVRIW